VKVSEAQSLMDRANQMSQAIASRAFEIFEEAGFPHGRDLDHWFKAEAELLHPVPISINELENALTVQAEVPGFRAAELQVGVEPRRVTISGKRETKEEQKKGKAVYREQNSSEIFRVIALPVEVDTSKATATLNNGIIELTLPKTAQSAAKLDVKTE
jgi:HSP20 family molecular chaperone IbpA